jgi:hypothetical protein
MVMVASLAAVGMPLEARADKFDETLDFSVHARASTLHAGAIGLRSGTDAAVSGTYLTGRARAAVPMLRAGLTLHGWRVGVGAGVEGYRGLRLGHEQPLPSAYTVTDGRVWGVPLEAFVGYAFRSGERVRPFVEARTTATVVQAQARLVHRDDGELGMLRMRATTVAVAATAGVLVHLNEYFFLEAGVGRVVYGTGGWTAGVAIGIPIPLSNL